MPRRVTNGGPPFYLYVLSAATYAVSGLVAIAWLPVMVLLAVLARPFDPHRRIAGRFLRLGARLAARSFPLWRIRVEGRWPSDGRAYVAVSNHMSHADILLLSHMPRELKWIGGSEAFSLPVLGWLFRLAGDLPVRPGDSSVALRTLGQAATYLHGGMSVMIFPEGKRNGGTLLPFKSGAFRLALQAGAPVLPVAVSGTDEGLRRDGWLLRPAELTARILDPVEVTGLGRQDHRTLREEVRSRIADAARVRSDEVERRSAAGSARAWRPPAAPRQRDQNE